MANFGQRLSRVEATHRARAIRSIDGHVADAIERINRALTLDERKTLAAFLARQQPYTFSDPTPAERAILRKVSQDIPSRDALKAATAGITRLQPFYAPPGWLAELLEN